MSSLEIDIFELWWWEDTYKKYFETQQASSELPTNLLTQTPN